MMTPPISQKRVVIFFMAGEFYYICAGGQGRRGLGIYGGLGYGRK
jgi:hypothetical protein